MWFSSRVNVIFMINLQVIFYCGQWSNGWWECWVWRYWNCICWPHSGRLIFIVILLYSAYKSIRFYDSCTKIQIALEHFPSKQVHTRIRQKKSTKERCKTCSSLTVKTQNSFNNDALVPLLLFLNIVHTFLYCFCCIIGRSKCLVRQ